MGLQESLPQLRDRLPPRRLLRLSAAQTAAPASREIDLARAVLPAPLRPSAHLAVLDASEYYGETSGGVRTYLMQKSRYVAARPALRQVLVVPGPADALTDAEGVRCYRLAGRTIPTQAPYRFMTGAARMRRVIGHERPDIAEAGSAYFVPWLLRGPARRLGVPVVWFCHGNIPRIIAPGGARDSLGRRVVSAAAARYVRSIADGVAMTLVASDFARRDLEAYGVERIARVPLGVDLELFHPRRRAQRDATRARHGLPAGPLAVYAGRFTGEKQLDVAIDGWRSLAQSGITLALVGDGPLRARLAAQAVGLPVTILPFEHDRGALADLYAAADIYLAPGPAETFGLAALEAMACGTPVLSVDSGGVAEQVQRSGAGAVYPLGDARALAEAALRLAESGPDTAGTRGRRFAEAHHGWDTVFDRVFAVYREVLSR